MPGAVLTIACSAVLTVDGVNEICSQTETLAWIRVGCKHEHVDTFTCCAGCRRLLQQSMRHSNADERLCYQCLDHAARLTTWDGQPLQAAAHNCQLHIDGIHGELGTPETHPKPATTTRPPQ